MRVLITGAGGAVGFELALLHAAAGHEVIALYRSHAPIVVHDLIKPVCVNLEDGLKNLETADVVYHLAAETHLNQKASAETYTQSNIVGSLAVAKYVERVSPKLTVFFSTLSVYGTIQQEILRSDHPFCAPNLYGVSKIFGEHIFAEIADNHPCLALRLPGVVGRGLYTSWVGRTFEMLQAGRDVTIFNPNALFNNITTPRDIIALVNDALTANFSGFEAHNIGASNPMTIGTMVHYLANAVGASGSITEIENTQSSFSIDVSALFDRFHHIPRTTQEMLHDFVEANTKSGEC